VVVVAHHLRTAAVHSVATDDVRGAQLAVDHLLQLGHQRIAHISVAGSPPGRDRRRGYERAMKRAGLTLTVVPGDFTEEAGYAAATALLRGDAPPTAIVAPNDLAAIGAFNAVEDAGLSVPPDVSIVGYDDTALAALRHISLTTVRQPRRALGERAVQVLLDVLDGGEPSTQHVLLDPELVTRSTTGPPR
jgi:DNA-binding LacI/PurR family transcriptional regulator